MTRILLGLVLAGTLFPDTIGLAQNPPRLLPALGEPPMAEPGEFKPAPDSVLVVPGQILGNLEGAPITSRALEVIDDPKVRPAQFAAPAPAPVQPTPVTPAPTVLYPEPPTPTVRISVKGMDTAPSGQELAYKIVVTNASEARAHHVIVRCPLPKGTKLVKALPQPDAEGKDIEWKFDTLEANANRTIEVVLKPTEEIAEITLIGRVQFEHGRMIKTKIANPTLEMRKVGPAQGILHEPMKYQIIVKNPGKVRVTDIQVTDTLPEGLEYVQETSAIPVSKVGPAPNQRTWTLGAMEPNDTRTLEFRVMPRKIGEWTSEATANGSGVAVKAGCNSAIQEAKLSLQVAGPVNEKATANQATPYLMSVHNTGSATLYNVRVTCSFPAEMRLAKSASGSQIFKDAVQWVVPKLGPAETKEFSVSLIAPSSGTREVQVSARADRGLEQRKKVPTLYEGIPALNWQVEGTPLAALGQEVTYTITIKNPGSAPAKNVKLVADLPEHVEFRNGTPAFQRAQGAIFFNTFEIPPKETVALKITATAKKSGDARFHFEMNAEGMSSGPLKNTRATTISPAAPAPKGKEKGKDVDPSRIGVLPPLDIPEAAAPPSLVVPAINISPIEPTSPPGP